VHADTHAMSVRVVEVQLIHVGGLDHDTWKHCRKRPQKLLAPRSTPDPAPIECEQGGVGQPRQARLQERRELKDGKDLHRRIPLRHPSALSRHVQSDLMSPCLYHATVPVPMEVDAPDVGRSPQHGALHVV
jgi:hypothetical protein